MSDRNDTSEWELISSDDLDLVLAPPAPRKPITTRPGATTVKRLPADSSQRTPPESPPPDLNETIPNVVSMDDLLACETAANAFEEQATHEPDEPSAGGLTQPISKKPNPAALGLPLFFALVGFTFIRLAAESAVRAGTAPPPSLSTPRAARHFNPGPIFYPSFLLPTLTLFPSLSPTGARQPRCGDAAPRRLSADRHRRPAP